MRICYQAPRRQLGNRFLEERECRGGVKKNPEQTNRQERDGPLGIGGVSSGRGEKGGKKQRENTWKKKTEERTSTDMSAAPALIGSLAMVSRAKTGVWMP